MKHKLKNLSISFIIAVILTIIFVTLFYSTYRNVYEIQSESKLLSSEGSINKNQGHETHQNFLFFLMIIAILSFSGNTIMSYIIIERFRKK